MAILWRSRGDGWPAAMVAVATFASLCVLALLCVVLYLSVIAGQPGDPLTVYTFKHYTDVFLNPFTWEVLRNTVAFSVVTLTVALMLGVPIAWLVERSDLPGKSMVFTSMTMGLLIPGFAVAIGWLFLLHPRIGLINQWLVQQFGLSEAPFTVLTVFAMGCIEGLTVAPVAFVMTSVAFRSMDSSLEEGARMGGAGMGRTLAKVTLPLAWPAILAAGIYIFTIGFAAFDIPAIIGMSSRLFTFSTYSYFLVSPAQALPEYGPVAALSAVMILLAVGLSRWYRSVQRRARRFAVVTGKAYRPTIHKLGRHKATAVGFVSLYLTLSQLLPILVLVWCALLPFQQVPSAEAFARVSLRNFQRLSLDLVLNGARNTAILMALAPTITVLVSLAISWVVLRSRTRGRAIFDFFAFLPLAVPAIVFSMAAFLVALFILRGVVPIYGTIWILLLVYVVARLSYGTRMTNSALIQIHGELEESAQVCGANVGGILRRVIVPLLTPTMLYAWIWLALLTYRELTLPLILSTVDNLPLSVVVWSLWNGSRPNEAAALTVGMLAIMAPILFAYWAVIRRLRIVPAG